MNVLTNFTKNGMSFPSLSHEHRLEWAGAAEGDVRWREGALCVTSTALYG